MRKQLIMMTMMLALLTIGANLAAATTTASPYDGMKGEMALFIEQMMQATGISGVSVALVDGEETVWAEGFGYADVEKKIAADERTVYSLASISKVFTGIAIMQLVEQGAVNLDSPLTDYIPEFSIKSRFCRNEPFTIRDLLTHHSGLPGPYQYPGREPFTPLAVERLKSYNERLLDFLADEHLAYRPGYVHAYSNVAYDLLAIVVERVSGLSIVDYTAQNIFAPLGMDASFNYLFLRDDLGERMALPHSGGKAAPKVLLPSPGSGSLNSDVLGMANFMKALLAGGSYNGRRIIGEAALREMTSVQNGDVALDKEVDMGLGFFLNDHNLDYAGKTYGHSGGLVYYTSTFKVVPEHGLGVVVVCNSNGGRQVVHAIALKALMQALAIKKGILPPQVAEPVEIPLTEAQANRYAGLYATRWFGPLQLTATGSRLSVNLMGMNLELKLLDTGWFKLDTQIPGLDRSRFRVELIEGKKRLFGKDLTDSALLGEEYVQNCWNSSLIWEWRAGEYRIVEDDPTLQYKKSEKFQFKVENGVLSITSNEDGTTLLTPISPEECLVSGIGLGAGSTVYFKEEWGRTVIKWGGYTLEKPWF